MGETCLDRALTVSHIGLRPRWHHDPTDGRPAGRETSLFGARKVREPAYAVYSIAVWSRGRCAPV